MSPKCNYGNILTQIYEKIKTNNKQYLSSLTACFSQRSVGRLFYLSDIKEKKNKDVFPKQNLLTD